MSTAYPRCYELYFEGGGEVPKELASQVFVSTADAERAIESYIKKKSSRGKSRGTTGNKPRAD